MPLTEEQISAYIGSVKKTFLKHGKIGLIPIDVYEYLVDNGAINLDNEEKAKIRRMVELEARNSSMCSDLELKVKMGRICENKYDFEAYVVNECKRRAVADFFTLKYQLDNF